MSIKSKLDSLKRILGAENFFLAEAFIEQNFKPPYKIKKNSNLYVAAVEYIGTLFKEEKPILSPKDLETLKKDRLKNQSGSAHKKLLKEFEKLEKQNKKEEGKPSARGQTKQPLPDPIPAGSAKKDPPEVTLESDKKRVQKGGSAIVTWASKNAARISRTNIPGVTARSPLNGSIEVEVIRRRRDLYIVVESLDGQKAEANTQILVETQEYQRKKEKGIVDEEPPTPQPRPSLTNLVSPSSRPQPEPRRRPTPDAESSNINTNILVSIDKSLTNINTVLASQLKLGQRIFDTERKAAEASNRLKKEEQMEEREGPSGTSLMKAGAEKMLSPFKAIIDKIVNFLFYTFLGRAFTEIVKWMNDPANKGKVDALGKFLKAAWPIILGLSVLFLTPLGSFILGTIQFLSGTAKTLKGLKGLIDKLIFKKGAKPPVKGGPGVSGKPKVTTGGQPQPRGPFARKFPISGDVQPKGFRLPKAGALLKGGLRAAGTGLAAFGGSAAIDLLMGGVQGDITTNISKNLQEMSPEDRENRLDKFKQIIKREEEYQKSPFFKLQKLLTIGKGFYGGGDETQSEMTTRLLKSVLEKAGSYSTGGQIFSGLVTEKDGVKVSGAGKDTQAFPVMGGGTAVLQPGEVVLNKAGVKNALAMGIDPLKLNTGPNANKPANITTGIKAMSTGGMVGSSNPQGILNAAKTITGMGKGVANQCANTTRAVLSKVGNVFGAKTTAIGDLDVPKGPSKFTKNPEMAASLAGSDVGKVIRSKPQIKGGDLIFWRADRDKGGDINKGAVTHVGIAADDGLKTQFDHNSSRGWHHRPHWHSADGTSWFAGIRLNSEKPTVQKQTPKLPSPSIGQMMFRPAGGEKYGGDPRGDSDNLITNHSGIKLPYSQDNILMRAERGEYVVPSAAVKKYGVSNLDKISSLDPNFKNNSLEIPRPIPKSNLSRDPIMLPPITQGQNMIGSSASGSGTQIPSFGATCPSSSAGTTRKILCDTYGIIA